MNEPNRDGVREWNGEKETERENAPYAQTVGSGSRCNRSGGGRCIAKPVTGAIVLVVCVAAAVDKNNHFTRTVSVAARRLR